MIRSLREKLQTFWDRPTAALLLFMGVIMTMWTLQCSLLQNILGLDILETVTWGAQMTWGHSKHPPLSGWLGYFFSAISGHADWSLYLAAQASLMIGVWYVYKLAREFFSPYPAAVSALLLFFLFYYNPSETKFSTYFVEIALRPVMAYYFFLALRDRKLRQWLLFGLFCGLGMLNKYSTALLLIAFLVVFLLKKEYRKQFCSPGPWLAALVFLLVLSPHLVWLWNHDFACLKHVGSRMTDKHAWYLPLLVIGATLYPFAVQGGVLMLSVLPGFRSRERRPVQRDILRWSLILTLIPSGFFILISLFGSGVILMWFCSLASWTGIAAVAAFPFEIDRTVFKRIFLLLVLLTCGIFIGTTIDLLAGTRIRIHTKPEAIVDPVVAFWKSHRSDPIPVVVGTRWEATVMENYTPGRPPACEVNDDVFFDRYRDLIQEKGALLIGKQDSFADFIRKTGYTELKLQKITFPCRSLLGRKRTGRVYVACYPSRSEREKQRSAGTGK